MEIRLAAEGEEDDTISRVLLLDPELDSFGHRAMRHLAGAGTPARVCANYLAPSLHYAARPPMPTFDLEERHHSDPGVRLVEMSGELDLTNTGDVEARLDELGDDATILVLDLNRVLFIDSAGLHVLFRLARTRGPHRFGIVVEPTAAIARTLEIVALTRHVPTRASADEVLAAIASSA